MAKGKQGPEDTNAMAFRVVQTMIARTEGTETVPDVPEELSRVRAEAGRAGGLKGGAARAAKLTSEERSEIARKAVQKRWAKQGG